MPWIPTGESGRGEVEGLAFSYSSTTCLAPCRAGGEQRTPRMPCCRGVTFCRIQGVLGNQAVILRQPRQSQGATVATMLSLLLRPSVTEAFVSTPGRAGGLPERWEQSPSPPLLAAPPSRGPSASLCPYKGTTSRHFTLRMFWVPSADQRHAGADFAKWGLLLLWVFCHLSSF